MMIRNLLVCLTVLLVLSSGVALHAAEPADSAIKGALYDIERAEKQVPSLTPSRAANIKRLQRSLDLAEDRLQASTNKSHPSYIEAAERLARLKHVLSELAAGRTPGAAPAASEPAPAVVIEEAPATADPAVAAATKELQRISGELDKMPPGNMSLLKRYRIQLNTVAEKLNAIPNKQDPAWAAAATAYNGLNERMNQLVAAGQSGTGGSTQSGSATSAAEADPAIGRAGRELDMIARQVNDARSVNMRLAERFLRDLDRIDGALAGVADKSHPSWTAVKDHHTAVRTGIVDMMANAVGQSLNKVVERVNGFTPLQYLVADDVRWVRNSLAGLQSDADTLGDPQHSETLQAVVGALANVRGAFEERVAAAEAKHAKLGDVDGDLKAVDMRVRTLNVPQPLRPDATEADIRAFAEAADAVRAHIVEDLAFLQKIEGKTPLTVEQGNMFRRAQYELGSGKPDGLQRAIQQSNQAVDAHVGVFENMIPVVEATDPLDRDHMANRLLGKGSFEETRETLTNGIAAVKLAAFYDQSIGRADGTDRAAQTQKFEQSIALWEEKYRTALDASRMPEEKSTDSDLLDAAAEVLARPDYAYDYERMVINYDLHRREKETGDINAGTVTTTITVYHYVWDEFQVTTAEREEDGYYLYYNSLRHYYKGDNNTPLNKWILSGRFQGQKILADNIHE